MAEAQSKIAEPTGWIKTAREKLKVGDDAMIDIENASLEDVHAHTDVKNANIAVLIMGLDDVTSGFSKDFDEMRNKTGWEILTISLLARNQTAWVKSVYALPRSTTNYRT